MKHHIFTALGWALALSSIVGVSAAIFPTGNPTSVPYSVPYGGYFRQYFTNLASTTCGEGQAI
jgi:hypothetical protein